VKPRLALLIGTLAVVAMLTVSLVLGLGNGDVETRPPPENIPAAERVRVEVLNAAGIPGLARAATEQLREAGFDVVYYGNAATFDRDSTIVLDRVGKAATASRVAAALGVANHGSEPDSTLYVDVSVILGSDRAPSDQAGAADSFFGGVAPPMWRGPRPCVASALS
jgi:hypothetical protein